MTYDDLARLSVSGRRLYWDGEELATVVRLTLWQGIAAAVVTVATAIMGLESLLRIIGALE